MPTCKTSKDGNMVLASALTKVGIKQLQPQQCLMRRLPTALPSSTLKLHQLLALLGRSAQPTPATHKAALWVSPAG
jgi:hypothetical protein